MLKRLPLACLALLLSLLATGCGTSQTVGVLGTTGATGPTGPAGAPGILFLNAWNAATNYVSSDVVTYQGSSYFALQSSVNVAPGSLTNPASVADWALLAAAGATGSTGAAGTTGAQGTQGLTGLQGLPGATGPAGIPGPMGPAGVAGATGPAGAAGAAGSPGLQGATGAVGVAGPAGPTGAQGIQGLQGVAGPAGLPGTTGATGVAGATGPAGVTGLTGAMGATGPAGLTGATGMVGATGAIGATGATGLAGAAGATGVAGPTGLTGATGVPGSQGLAGMTGPTGAQGVKGSTGDTGPAGPTGSAGLAGSAGATGATGAAGATGATGAQGLPGTLAGSYLTGVKFGVQGDSISAQFGNAWQNVVVQRTGMQLNYQDARPARRFDQAFECWGNPPVGSQPGQFDPTYVFPAPQSGQFGSCGNSAFIGIPAGTNFAASLANVDLLVIQLGTNDGNVPLGQLGDATTAGTYYGNMRWVVESYLNAKPTLRVVLVTTQYNGFYSPATAAGVYAAATEAYGNSIGIPVINMYKLGGVNAQTVQTLTNNSDTVHPSPFNFSHIYGPVIAQGLQQIF